MQPSIYDLVLNETRYRCPRTPVTHLSGPYTRTGPTTVQQNDRLPLMTNDRAVFESLTPRLSVLCQPKCKTFASHQRQLRQSQLFLELPRIGERRTPEASSLLRGRASRSTINSSSSSPSYGQSPAGAAATKSLTSTNTGVMVNTNTAPPSSDNGNASVAPAGRIGDKTPSLDARLPQPALPLAATFCFVPKNCITKPCTRLYTCVAKRRRYCGCNVSKVCP